MEQTAVEWLVDALLGGKLLMPSLIEQAKKMEKQQILEANIAGMEFIAVDPNRYMEDAEKYYKENY